MTDYSAALDASYARGKSAGISIMTSFLMLTFVGGCNTQRWLEKKASPHVVDTRYMMNAQLEEKTDGTQRTYSMQVPCDRCREGGTNKIITLDFALTNDVYKVVGIKH